MQAYAMTEASHQMTSNPLPKHGAHKPGTVGKAQGTVQVRKGGRKATKEERLLASFLHFSKAGDRASQ